MNPSALVSIVIPTYNRAADLTRALTSIVAQTYPHWEVLVVDNHSSDDTDQIVAAFQDSRIKLLKIHNRGVIAVSRNMGIRSAQGEYVAFLDSDDWWTPRKLEESVQYLSAGADVVYHDLYKVTRRGQPRFANRRVRAWTLDAPVFKVLLTTGNALPNSSVVMRREILQAIAGLSEDPELVTAEDYDAWLRAAAITDKFVRIPRALGYYWAGGGSMSRRPDRTLASLVALERRHADSIAASAPISSIAWIQYSRGQAHYLMGSYEQARTVLQPIRWPAGRVLARLNARRMVLGCVARSCGQRLRGMWERFEQRGTYRRS